MRRSWSTRREPKRPRYFWSCCLGISSSSSLSDILTKEMHTAFSQNSRTSFQVLLSTVYYALCVKVAFYVHHVSRCDYLLTVFFFSLFKDYLAAHQLDENAERRQAITSAGESLIKSQFLKVEEGSMQSQWRQSQPSVSFYWNCHAMSHHFANSH